MTRVAYLGPAGTWSEAAILAVPEAADAERVPFVPIPAVIEAVAHGEADYAVVPMRNSLEGGVNATLDTLAQVPGVAIVGETTMAIRHCLIAAPGTTMDEVRRVLSHAQATAQCQGFLREHLPAAEVLTVASTAQAVRDAVAQRAGTAAIGTAPAAALYGGRILREDISDEAGNRTRFVWIAREGATPWPVSGGERWRTSVAFWGPGDDAPGWLVACLSEFSDRGLNMSRIESRPWRGTLEHYRFFVDLDARAEDPAVREALAALAGRCQGVRVLGGYPAAEPG